MRGVHLSLRPVIYRQPDQVVAYEVDGLPAGHRAGIVESVGVGWEIAWTDGDRRRVITGEFVTPEAALAKLSEAILATTVASAPD